MDTRVRTNPFPGLRPYMVEEADLFFGREKQSDELVRRLGIRRFLAVVGTSGSGKSSLVRAGLLPSLDAGFMASAGAHWRMAIMRPQDDPLGFLARALVDTGALSHLEMDRAAAEGIVETTLRRSSLGLIEAARMAGLEPHENLLVLVDQFEELFRFTDVARQRGADEASAFVKLLLEAAKQTDVPVYVVITMRSDFLGECARFRDLPEAISDSQYLIPRLTRDELHSVITSPVGVRGGRIAPTLVQRLLNDVGDDMDQLPVLQHALMRAWDHWKSVPPDSEGADEIGLDDYDAVGGMDRALSLHADAVFDGLADGRSPAEAAKRRTIAERLFKSLAATGSGGSPIRRIAAIQEVADIAEASPDEVISVVEAFRAPGNSFLMPPAGEPLTAEHHIDISHESLIRNWSRMTHWVGEEAESARMYERLSSTAVLHEKGEAGLWGHPDLGVAVSWRAAQKPNAAWARRYNTCFDQAMKFLDASQAQAHAIEDAKGARRRRWTLTLGLLFFAMLSVVVSWWNEDRTRAAERSAQEEAAKDTLWALRQVVDGGCKAAKAATEGEKMALLTDGSLDSRRRHALLQQLCGELPTDGSDTRMVAIYRTIVEGHWRDATEAILGLGDPKEADRVHQMLDRIANWGGSRAERDRLVSLREGVRGRLIDGGGAMKRDDVMHPVHHRITQALERKAELLIEEYRLLDFYDTIKTNPTRGREQADGLRELPFAGAYARLASTALNPESKIRENAEWVRRMSMDYWWLIGPFLLWPLWYGYRLLQLRMKKPVPSRPHLLRRAAAVLLDFSIALLVGVATGVFISYFSFDSDGFSGVVAVLLAALVGLVAGIVYLLLGDAIRLRYRRSIGKALFGLRPVIVGGDAAAGRVTLMTSLKRNAILLAALIIAIPAGLVAENSGGDGAALAGFLGVLLATGLANLWRAWRKNGETFADRWSRTRVIDADSAESLAIRP